MQVANEADAVKLLRKATRDRLRAPSTTGNGHQPASDADDWRQNQASPTSHLLYTLGVTQTTPAGVTISSRFEVVSLAATSEAETGVEGGRGNHQGGQLSGTVGVARTGSDEGYRMRRNGMIKQSLTALVRVVIAIARSNSTSGSSSITQVGGAPLHCTCGPSSRF